MSPLGNVEEGWVANPHVFGNSVKLENPKHPSSCQDHCEIINVSPIL